MDVVYVIGTGSKWDNNELRYSLRSIEKFASGLGEVYIVGDELPDFLDPKAVHYIQCSDVPGCSPALNVYGKIERFFLYTKVDRFLLSSDDHFFIKPVDFEHWPIHYKGEAMPAEYESGLGDKRYTQTMIDTRNFMKEKGLDLKYYEGHTNKLYTRAAWRMLFVKYEGNGMYGPDPLIRHYLLDTKFGISMNSPVAAMHMFLNPSYPCQYRKDIKLRHLNTPDDWEQLKDASSFSVYNSAIHSGVAGFLQVMFPEPSRFEKI